MSITFIFSIQLLPAQDTLVKKLGDNLIKLPSSMGLSIGLYTDSKDHFYDFGTVEKGKKAMLPSKNVLYEIGSIAKTFASYLLAKAILENKIRPDDDIRKYLDGSYPNLEYAGQPIRIIHLANGTSCIPDWLPETPAVIKNADPDSARLVLTKTINVDLATSKVVDRDKDVYSVAMSWYSYKNDKGYSQTWYDGGTHGFSSYVVFYSELDTVIVLLANVADPVTPGKLRGIAYEIAEKINKNR